MARVLIVGCGQRGRELARGLLAAGHTVRGTTRHRGHLAAIERTGAEAVCAVPDRVATLVPAFADVAVACLLLGSAMGPPAEIEALHTTRLETLLTRMIDTPIRGVLYEAAGTVDRLLLARGAALVEACCERSRIPYRVLHGTGDEWPLEAIEAVETLLFG